MDFFGILKLAESPLNRSFLEKMALRIFCNKYLNLCDFLLHHFTDLDSTLIDKDQIPFFLTHIPARCSTKSLEHFSQLMENKDKAKFTYYDYGKTENRKRYNQDFPPEYDLKKIKIPVFLYHGEDDLLSTPDNNFLLH